MIDATEIEVRPGGGLFAAVPWRMSHRTQGAVLGVILLLLFGVAEFVMSDGLIIRGGAPGYAIVTSIGLGFLYTVVAGWVNYTYVTVDSHGHLERGYRERPSPRMLRITIGPLPWPGGRSLPIESIAEVYVSAHGDERRREHRVHARLTSGERITLVHRHVTVEDALYLMEHITDALELDRAVMGAAGDEEE